VDQDSIAAKRIVNNGNRQVFAKMERNGDAIVGLFNAGETEMKISTEASAVGLSKNENGYSTDNLWTGETKKTSRDIGAIVPPHGVVLYRVKAL
jgi:Alpha galactosidase C-terminal beta sandwich domain